MADVLRALLRPGVERPVAWRWFAFTLPVVLHLLYFGSLALTEGLWWSLHVWLGTALFTGVAGWLLSYLVLPPRIPEALPEPIEGVRPSASWTARPAGPAATAVGSAR